MWFFGLIVVLLIGAVAVVASGRWGAMSTAYDDRPDMTVPARQALTSTDIESARFGVGLRGYRMDEVDTLLERVAKEVAERDRRIADLERAVAPIVEAPDGAGFTSRGSYDPAEFDDTGVQQPILVGGDFPESATDPADRARTEPTTAEQPAVDEPTALQRPAPGQSATGQPSAQQPGAEQPTAGQSSALQPNAGQSTTGQPSAEQSTAGQPSAEQSTAGQPSAVQPTARQTAGQQPAAQQPTEAQPTAEHSTGAQSAGAQSAAGQAAIGLPTADPLTADHSAIDQSAVEQPSAAPPQPEPSAEAPAIDDDEQDTREVPRTSHAAAADEYERLQSEARALLEAQ
jgi:DivIVA domain-containing protein